MKKITFVSLISFIFLSLCSIFELIFRNIPFENAWIPLIIGVLLLIVSGVIAKIVERKVLGNSLCFLLNAVALGLCIRSWYIYRNFNNELWVMLLISFACVIYLMIFYLLLYIPAIEKIFNIYLWVFLISTLVSYLIVMSLSETTFISTFGYFVIIEIAFIFAMCKTQNTTQRLFRDIVLSTYSVFFVAILIALIMLGADSLDGIDPSLDMGFDGLASPKKQKLLNDTINL